VHPSVHDLTVHDHPNTGGPFVLLAPHTADPAYAPLHEIARAYGLTNRAMIGLRTPEHVPVVQARDAVRSLRDAAARAGYRVHGTLADEPVPSREQLRHRAAVARLEERHGDLAEFARSMAVHLPGRWKVELPPMETSFRQQEVTDRIWDEGHLYWLAVEFAVDRAAILTGPRITELVVVDRIYGRKPFMVGVLIPPGANPELRPHDAPNGVSVPRDPARAADRVARRLLPTYRRAVAQTTPATAHRPATATATPTAPAVTPPVVRSR
jgi:hypothetical protein